MGRIGSSSSGSWRTRRWPILTSVLSRFRRWSSRSGATLRRLPSKFPFELAARATCNPAACWPSLRRETIYVRAVWTALPLPIGLRQASRAKSPSSTACRENFHVRISIDTLSLLYPYRFFNSNDVIDNRNGFLLHWLIVVVRPTYDSGVTFVECNSGELYIINFDGVVLYTYSIFFFFVYYL